MSAYYLMHHPEKSVFPTALKSNDQRVVDLMVAGYEIKAAGSKWQIECIQERFTSGIVNSLDEAFWGVVLEPRGSVFQL